MTKIWMSMRFLLLGMCLLIQFKLAVAQGCSDAGFCSVDGLAADNGFGVLDDRSNHIRTGIAFGNADHSISTIAGYIEYGRQLSSKLRADIKLTGLAQSGNDISVFAFSDVYLNAVYQIDEDWTLIGGVKIPLNTADRTENDLPLPMDYQSSLGTFDLLLGIGYTWGKLKTSFAWQQPLNTNGNQFLSSDYAADNPLSAFQSTNEFQRKGDILLRLTYPLQLSEKFIITPGILPIYHLANDSFTDEIGVEMEIEGSSGLTFNINGFVDYIISPQYSIQLNMGLPLVVRDARPDGLTRSFVLGLDFYAKF